MDFIVNFYNLSNFVFEDEIENVYFKTKDGVVGIHSFHENANFEIYPGTIIFNYKQKSMKKYYIGFGNAFMENNVLTITAFPIANSYEEFEVLCKNLGNLGNDCLKNIEKLSILN